MVEASIKHEKPTPIKPIDATGHSNKAINTNDPSEGPNLDPGGRLTPEPIRIVKVSPSKWKVERSPSAADDDDDSSRQNSAAATSPLECEVLRYVRMPRRRKGKVTVTAAASEAASLAPSTPPLANGRPSFFDEDDFDIVVEGPADTTAAAVKASEARSQPPQPPPVAKTTAVAQAPLSTRASGFISKSNGLPFDKGKI